MYSHEHWINTITRSSINRINQHIAIMMQKDAIWSLFFSRHQSISLSTYQDSDKQWKATLHTNVHISKNLRKKVSTPRHNRVRNVQFPHITQISVRKEKRIPLVSEASSPQLSQPSDKRHQGLWRDSAASHLEGCLKGHKNYQVRRTALQTSRKLAIALIRGLTCRNNWYFPVWHPPPPTDNAKGWP